MFHPKIFKQYFEWADMAILWFQLPRLSTVVVYLLLNCIDADKLDAIVGALKKVGGEFS